MIIVTMIIVNNVILQLFSGRSSCETVGLSCQGNLRDKPCKVMMIMIRMMTMKMKMTRLVMKMNNKKMISKVSYCSDDNQADAEVNDKTLFAKLCSF